MNPKGQNLTSAINYQYGANNSPNNFVQDFMGLDEFFEMTTAAAASAERNGSCDGYSDTFGSSAESQSSLASCGVRRRAVSLNSAPFDIEKQIQEIPEMDETCAESSRTIAGDGGADAYSDRGTGARRRRTNSLSAERTSSCSSPSKDNDKGKDKKYWDRRVKNNMAAKRSRDAKRLREISVVERWNFLEEENKRLKKEISDMQERTQKLESVLGHTHENSEQ